MIVGIAVGSAVGSAEGSSTRFLTTLMLPLVFGCSAISWADGSATLSSWNSSKRFSIILLSNSAFGSTLPDTVDKAKRIRAHTLSLIVDRCTLPQYKRYEGRGRRNQLWNLLLANSQTASSQPANRSQKIWLQVHFIHQKDRVFYHFNGT